MNASTLSCRTKSPVATPPSMPEDALEFTGYASLFNLPDASGDIIGRGAFRNTLMRRGTYGIRMLWNHDPVKPIGVWLALKEDAHGLLVHGRLVKGVMCSTDAGRFIAEGAIDGLSIGFRTLKAKGTKNRGRIIEEVDLWEISLVAFPMHPRARILRSPVRSHFSPTSSINLH